MFKALRRLWLGLTLIALTSGFLLMSDLRQRAVPKPAFAACAFSSAGTYCLE